MSNITRQTILDSLTEGKREYMRVTLRQLDLSEMDLSDCRFSFSNLAYANLSNSVLTGSSLHGAYLTMANLQGADLDAAGLIEADLHAADLSGVTLAHSNLQRANLRDAILTGADLSETKLDNTLFTDANLTGANLRKAKANAADFSGANLTGADFSGADLREATFCPHTTQLDNATFTGAILPDDNASLLAWWVDEVNFRLSDATDETTRAAWRVELARLEASRKPRQPVTVTLPGELVELLADYSQARANADDTDIGDWEAIAEMEEEIAQSLASLVDVE